MIKTLDMELADYHKELSHYFYNVIYKGALRDEHAHWCAFNENIENRCDCPLLEAYKLLKHWVRT